MSAFTEWILVSFVNRTVIATNNMCQILLGGYWVYLVIGYYLQQIVCVIYSRNKFWVHLVISRFFWELGGFLVRLLWGLASSDATITLRIIVPRCTETYVSYIEYLQLPLLVTILDSQGYQKRKPQPFVCCQYTKVLIGYGQTISA